MAESPLPHNQSTPLDFPVREGQTSIARARIILEALTKTPSSDNLCDVIHLGVQVPGLTNLDCDSLAADFPGFSSSNLRKAFPVVGESIADDTFKNRNATL